MASKSETETIICWTADEERATVYSLMPRIWKQCLLAGGEEIRLKEGVREGVKVGRTFLVPVKSVRIRKARQLTEEQQETKRAQGRALAARQMGLQTKQ